MYSLFMTRFAGEKQPRMFVDPKDEPNLHEKLSERHPKRELPKREEKIEGEIEETRIA